MNFNVKSSSNIKDKIKDIYMILDPRFEEFVSRILRNTIRKGANNYNIGMVNMVADYVSESYLRAETDGMGEHAKRALSSILRAHTGVFTEEKMLYTSTVWPSIFTTRLNEDLGSAVFTEAFEPKDDPANTDEYRASLDKLYNEFANFYSEFKEYCMSGGKKGKYHGANNSQKYKTDFDNEDLPVHKKLVDVQNKVMESDVKNAKGVHMILDPRFEEFVVRVLLNTIKKGNNNYNVGMVNMVADYVSESYLRAEMDGLGDNAKLALSSILRAHTGIYTKEQLKYTSVVWPTVFVERLNKNLGHDIFAELLATESEEYKDSVDKLHNEFDDFYFNHIRAKNKSGAVAPNNDTRIYKTELDTMELPRHEKLTEIQSIIRSQENSL